MLDLFGTAEKRFLYERRADVGSSTRLTACRPQAASWSARRAPMRWTLSCTSAVAVRRSSAAAPDPNRTPMQAPAPSPGRLRGYLCGRCR